MRGVESFAYDLIVLYGPVSSRVALLLRSTEGKPSHSLDLIFNLPIIRLITGLQRGLTLRCDGTCARSSVNLTGSSKDRSSS